MTRRPIYKRALKAGQEAEREIFKILEEKWRCNIAQCTDPFASYDGRIFRGNILAGLIEVKDRSVQHRTFWIGAAKVDKLNALARNNFVPAFLVVGLPDRIVGMETTKYTGWKRLEIGRTDRGDVLDKEPGYEIQWGSFNQIARRDAASEGRK